MHGGLLNYVKKFCSGSSACVRISGDLSEWFEMNMSSSGMCDVTVVL